MNVNFLGNSRRAGLVRLVVLVFVGLCLAAAPVSAETGFYDFLSPDFLGGSANSVSLESPPGHAPQPRRRGRQAARDAGPQLHRADGLLARVPLGRPHRQPRHHPPDPGRACSPPSDASPRPASTSLDWGALGGLHLSFAKDLFEDLYIGIGLGFEFGADWGLWGDLGFLHLPGDIGFMKDFRWGVALRGLGKGYEPADSSLRTASPGRRPSPRRSRPRSR